MAANFDFDDLEEIITTESENDPFAGLGGLAGDGFHQGGRRGPARESASFVVETCIRCGGSGRYGTYRALGPCYACKGTGKRQYKQDWATRAKARTQTADRKVRKAEEWKQANADVVAWIAARAPRFGFAASMQEALGRYGSLTDAQLATCQRLAAQDKARDEQRAIERAQADAAAPAVSIEPIVTAFEHAMAAWKARKTKEIGEDAMDGATIEDPKLRLGEFFIEPSFKWQGALVVRATKGGATLGKLADGKFTRFRVCDDPTEEKIVQACADPKGAAKAYGIATKRCSCCGRKLTNKVSLAAGIGPICSENYGWGA